MSGRRTNVYERELGQIHAEIKNLGQTMKTHTEEESKIWGEVRGFMTRSEVDGKVLRKDVDYAQAAVDKHVSWHNTRETFLVVIVGVVTGLINLGFTAYKWLKGGG